MNLKTAGFASLVGFVLSFFAALIGGVPLFDVLVRAILWGVVLGGLAMGAEALLRSQVPDLFGPPPADDAEAGEEKLGEAVDIVLDDSNSRGSFVEEVSDDEQPASTFAAPPLGSPAAADAPARASSPLAPAESGDDEAMPEIGSFLNSFKPQGEGEAEGEEAPQGSAESPDIAEYVPQEAAPAEASFSGFAPSSGADLEGLEQDPAVLAKAVKSVMNKT